MIIFIVIPAFSRYSSCIT